MTEVSEHSSDLHEGWRPRGTFPDGVCDNSAKMFKPDPCNPRNPGVADDMVRYDQSEEGVPRTTVHIGDKEGEV